MRGDRAVVADDCGCVEYSEHVEIDYKGVLSGQCENWPAVSVGSNGVSQNLWVGAGYSDGVAVVEIDDGGAQVCIGQADSTLECF